MHVVFRFGRCLLLVTWVFSMPLWAQPAVLELEGTFGQCEPIYAATVDELTLYQSPNLESRSISLPYKKGWRVDTKRSEGMTRIIKPGELKVIDPQPLSFCSTSPTDGNRQLVRDELVQHLYDLGNGYARIGVRGGKCSAKIVAGESAFKSLSEPEVQVWLRVLYSDGSSPGWLLQDGTQTRVAASGC